MSTLDTIPTLAQKSLLSFIVLRHRVYLRRAEGLPKPWTKDNILQTYRFCNVYRELDRVTMYTRGPWAAKHAGQRHSWFSLVVARLINLNESLAVLPPVVPWRPQEFLEALEPRQATGIQVFGAAYIVSTNGQSVPKLRYLAEHVLTPMWEEREQLRPVEGMFLSEFHEKLMCFQGMGSFMAAQVVADVKNTKGMGLDRHLAPDWETWAAPGPGSLRGLNRLLGRGASRNGIKPSEFRKYLGQLRDYINPELVKRQWDPVCAQDMQNCLCEYDKYQRALLGEGTPKQLFSPHSPNMQGSFL